MVDLRILRPQESCNDIATDVPIDRRGLKENNFRIDKKKLV